MKSLPRLLLLLLLVFPATLLLRGRPGGEARGVGGGWVGDAATAGLKLAAAAAAAAAPHPPPPPPGSGGPLTGLSAAPDPRLAGRPPARQSLPDPCLLHARAGRCRRACSGAAGGSGSRLQPRPRPERGTRGGGQAVPERAAALALQRPPLHPVPAPRRWADVSLASTPGVLHSFAESLVFC